MDATPNRFAYRCLPLTIVNQTGWWIKNPVGFTATWRGCRAAGDDRLPVRRVADELWRDWINSQFGEGIITWNTPFLFRTKPAGSRLLVCGPVNYFKANAHPLTALIESDWMSMSFTMNWKIMVPEPAGPVRRRRALVPGDPAGRQRLRRPGRCLGDLPEADRRPGGLPGLPGLGRGPTQFHDQKAKGEVKPDDWQKDYFQGRDALGRAPATVHMTKVKPPADPVPAASRVEPWRPGLNRSPGRRHQRRRCLIARVEARPAIPRHLVHASLEPMRAPDHACQIDADVGTMADEARPRIETSIRTRQSRRVRRVWRCEQQPAPAADRARLRRGSTDEWRRWIAENLMLGREPPEPVEAMTASGISRDERREEIEPRHREPLFRRARSCSATGSGSETGCSPPTARSTGCIPCPSEVDRRHKLSRDEFLRDYYSTNRPVDHHWHDG